MQYPDTISFQDSADAVYDQSSGNYVSGADAGPVSSDCRYEPANGNAWISTQDGEKINFSGIVYMPRNAPVFKEGSEVTITEKRDGQEDRIFKQKVLRFHRGQLNARVWI